MSDLASSRWAPLPPIASMAFGLASAGVAALLVGAIYYHRAFRDFYLYNTDAIPVFLPVLITFACCIGVLSHRSRLLIIIFMLFSAAGLCVMLLQNQWGESIVDAAPERTKQYSRFTYVGDVLSCFGFATQLMASAIMLFIKGSSSRGNVDDKDTAGPSSNDVG